MEILSKKIRRQTLILEKKNVTLYQKFGRTTTNDGFHQSRDVPFTDFRQQEKKLVKHK